MNASIGVITNPNSKKNWRSKDRSSQLRRMIGPSGILRETRTLEQLPAAIDDLLDHGCDYWVCDGGDGTLHWAVNAGVTRLRERGQDASASLPIIVPTNGGTIDFVARKAGLKGSSESIIERLRALLDRGERPRTITIDTCRHRGTIVDGDGDASEFDRVGLATAVGGVGRQFFDKYYDLPRSRGAADIAGVIGAAAGGAIFKSLGPGLQRLAPATFREFGETFFRPTRARIEVDGRTLKSTSFLALQIGAIDINLAGVVRCFPRASADGALHFQALDTTPMGAVANIPALVLGRPLVGRTVYDDQVRNVTVTAEERPIDPVIDGERFYGLRELRLSLGPKLRIPLLPN